MGAGESTGGGAAAAVGATPLPGALDVSASQENLRRRSALVGEAIESSGSC